MYINTHKHKYNIIIHNLNMTLEKIKPQTIILPRGGGMSKEEKRNDVKGVILAVHVDDIVITGNDGPKKLRN